jgi:hypothetical protein
MRSGALMGSNHTGFLNHTGFRTPGGSLRRLRYGALQVPVQGNFLLKSISLPWMRWESMRTWYLPLAECFFRDFATRHVRCKRHGNCSRSAGAFAKTRARAL